MRRRSSNQTGNGRLGPPMEPKGIIHKAWLHSAIYAVGTLFLSAGQLAMAPLLTRRFTVAQFGSYEILLVTYIAMRTLLVIPLSSALVYGYCKHCTSEEEKTALLSTMSLLALLLAAVIAGFGLLVPAWPSWLLGSARVSGAVGPLILLTLALDVFVQLALGACRAAQQPVRYGLIAGLQLVGVLGLVWLLVGVRGSGVAGVFAAMCVGNLLTFGVILGVFRKKLFGRPEFSRLRPVAVFAMAMVPMNVANLVLSISDRYFLKAYWDLTTVGVYSLSYRLGSALTMFVVLPFLTAWPALIYSEKDLAIIANNVSKAAFNLWMIGLLFVVAGSASARPLLLLFGGEAFLPGANLIPLVALGGLLYGVLQVFLSLVVARGNLALNLKVLLTVSAVALLLNALFIPNGGMLGAAVATVVSYLLGAVLSVFAVNSITSLALDLSRWLKVGAAAFLGIAAGRLMDGFFAYALINAVVAATLSMTAYLAVLTMLNLLPVGFSRVCGAGRISR